MAEETYELLRIEWTLNYVFDTVESNCFLSEDEIYTNTVVPYDLDGDGIPIGSTIEAFKARQVIINDFWHRLKEKYKTPEEFKIHNTYLDEDIYLRAISLIEAKGHSAKNNLSTRAFLHVEDIIANARPVARVKTKEGDSNQKAFQQMLIMTCHYEGVGRVKLTVGVKKRKDAPEQKVEYSLTHLPDGSPLMPEQQKKKASHKK